MISINNNTANKRVTFVLAAAVLVFGLALVVYLANPPEDAFADLGHCSHGWKIGTSATINCHSDCQVVSNSGGRDFFVPTKASAEWSAFQGNPPSNASIGSCGGGGGGGGGTTYGIGTQCRCLSNLIGVLCQDVWRCTAIDCESWCINNCLGFDNWNVGTSCFSSCSGGC